MKNDPIIEIIPENLGEFLFELMKSQLAMDD